MSDHSTYRMMYMNALIGLENGHLMPWDKDILASAPLPDSVSDPYTTKEMPDVLELMKLTFNAMSIWVDEAKKVNYFSKRFVQLSRMVMNGVTTMGRGLVTLHARGEDLSQSPMSIQDLLGVASYHFRKSYLGVLQTSRSHPEIGERLLMNQIGWNNMLMRLFKTRDKLNSGVRIQGPGAREDQGARILDSGGRAKEPVVSGPCSGSKGQETQALPDTSDLLVQALSERTHTSDLKSPISTLTPPSALTEPGAFTASRAFSSYDSVPKKGLLPKATVPNNSLSPSGQALDGTSPIAEKLPKAAVPSSGMKKEDGRMKNEESANKLNEVEIEEEQKNKVNEAESSEEQQNERNEAEIEEKQQNEGNETEIIEEQQNERNGAEIKEEQQDERNGTGKENEISDQNGAHADGFFAAAQPVQKNCTRDASSDPEPLPPNEYEDSLIKGEPPGGFSGDHDPLDSRSSPKGENGTAACRQQSPPSEMPPYLQIMKNVFARSGPSENGELTFTFDELCYLAADSDFNRVYPDQAAQMRSILQYLNSS